MSYSNPKPANHSSTNSSVATPELKLYQAFIFSIPICFTFILLFLFYLFYLRRRSVDWSSLRMRTTIPNIHSLDISTAELGLKKEVREMLPIIIYNESFSVKDPQCSVCLGDYQADDKLQQIPTCGHAFHMDCIDRWLSTHTTCPLCRLSLLAKASSSDLRDNQDSDSVMGNTNEASVESGTRVLGETGVQPFFVSITEDTVNLHSDTNANGEQESHQHVNLGSEARDAEKKEEKDEQNIGTSETCFG